MEDKAFEKAIAFIKEDNKPAARDILTEIIEENPYDELAWWWFSQAHYTKKQQALILKKGLAANPDSELLANTLKKLDTKGNRVYQQKKGKPVPTPVQTTQIQHPPALHNQPEQEKQPEKSESLQPDPTEEETTPESLKIGLGTEQEKRSPLNLPADLTIPADPSTTPSKPKDDEFFSSLKFTSPDFSEDAKPSHDAPAPAEPFKPEKKLVRPPQPAPKKKTNPIPLYVMGGLTALVLLVQLVFFLANTFTTGAQAQGNPPYQETLAAQQVIGMQESVDTIDNMPTPSPQSAPSFNPDIINAGSGNAETGGVEPQQPSSNSPDETMPTEVAPDILNNNTSQETAETAETPEIEATQTPAETSTHETPPVETEADPSETTETTQSETPAPEPQIEDFDSMSGIMEEISIVGAVPNLPKSFFFLSTKNGPQQIYVMDASASHLVQITDEADGVRAFDVSQVTGAIAYITQNKLVLISDNYQNKEIIFEGEPFPDIASDTFTWTQEVSDPVWSPNGRYLAFGHNGIKLYSTNTREVESLITNAPPPQGETGPLRVYTPLSFSRDGLNLHVKVAYENGQVMANYELESSHLSYINLNACCDFSYGIDGLHLYLANANKNDSSFDGIWQINPLLSKFQKITNDDGLYLFPKQSPFGRLYYFYQKPSEKSFSIYSSHVMDMNNKILLEPGKYQISEALWTEDAYHVIIMNETTHTIQIVNTDGQPSTGLPFGGSHFRWGKTKDIDPAFLTPTETSANVVEVNLQETYTPEEIVIEEPKMSAVTDLNPDQQVFEIYKGVVYPPYPENLSLISFKQIDHRFNISVLHDQEKIMVWLGEYLSKYRNNKNISILRDVIVVPENLDSAGFSMGKCLINGIVEPGVYAIGSWNGSFDLDTIQYALWIDEENAQLFPIYRENIECVMDLLVQKKNNGFNIWNYEN